MSSIKENYLKQILSEIRFPFDRPLIKKELEEHLDESIEYYTVSTVTLEEAESLAIHDFGEPKEIGKLLNKVHKPFLGWIWILSKYGLIVLMILTVISSTPRFFEAWEQAQESTSPTEATEIILQALSYGASEVVVDKIVDQRFELKDGDLIFERMIILKEGVLILLVQQVDHFDPFAIKKTIYPLQRQVCLQLDGVDYHFETEQTSNYKGFIVLIAKDIPTVLNEYSIVFSGYSENFTLEVKVDLP
jgi:hypothetical protein